MHSLLRTAVLCLSLFALPISYAADVPANSCPFGQVNCTGQCGRFVDKNGDGFCDNGGLTGEAASAENEEERLRQTIGAYAQANNVDADALIGEISRYYHLPAVQATDTLASLHDGSGVCMDDVAGMIAAIRSGQRYERAAGELSGSELKAMTVAQAAAAYGVDATTLIGVLVKQYPDVQMSPDDLLGNLHDTAGIDMHTVKTVGETLRDGGKESPAIATSAPVAAGTSKAEYYHVYGISIFCILLYVLSLALRRARLMTSFMHHAILNTALLVLLIISGVLGMLLSVGIRLSVPFSVLYVHVVSGVALFWACIFHAADHRLYFSCILKKGTACLEAATKRDKKE
jgi:hypothetical protein